MTKPGIYRHYKGALYRVLFIAMKADNSDNPNLTQRPQVVYTALGDGAFYTRDEFEFDQYVKPVNSSPFSRMAIHYVVADGENWIPRFTYVGQRAVSYNGGLFGDEELAKTAAINNSQGTTGG